MVTLGHRRRRRECALDGLDLDAGILDLGTTRVVVDGQVVESDGKTEMPNGS